MKIQVWDLPLRLFHWLLAAAVITAFVAVQFGGNAMVWHGRAGVAVVGLVAFRIVWGLIGSTNARFTSFIKGPAAIKAYLRGEWTGVGHNPLGAYSVLALLAIVGTLAVTGLFANDDIAFQGYLYPLVSADISGAITEVHKFFEPLLIIFVALHLAAIGFYAKVKKDNLTIPMITGWKEVGEVPAAPVRNGSIVAFIVAVLIGLAAAYAASGELLPPPPEPTAVETPNF